MQLRFGLIITLSALSFASCSTISIDNGSLDYKNAATPEPLKYPEGVKVRPTTPLYPFPVVDPLAIEHAPILENKRGNRFEIPRSTVTQTVTPATENTVGTIVSRPQLLTDGNANPLIKIEGNSDTIWQYTLATLSSLNLNVVSTGKNTKEATIKIDDQTYVLKLNAVGSTNTLAVFNADNTFADKEKSAELLTQISQNWPA